MNSRYWRTLAGSFCVTVAIEFGLAYILSYVISERYVLFNAMLILVAFWGLQILVWIKSTLATTIYYYLVGKARWVYEVEEALEKFAFPVSDQIWPDTVEYLSTITQDSSSSLDQIRYAAASLGQLQLLKLSRPLTAMRMMAVFESALQNYRRQQRRSYRGEPSQD